jgi:hypothetical protein
MVDIYEISAVVAAAGVLVGVVYYMLDLRHQTKIRKTDLLTRLYTSTYTSKEFMDAFWKVMSLQVKDYQDYVRQYGSLNETDNPMNRAYFTVIGYYELVGVLLYRKLIDLVTVHDVLGTGNPIVLFEKIKPIIEGFRREANEPTALLGFKYLCDELKRKEAQLKKEFLGMMKDSNTYTMR